MKKYYGFIRLFFSLFLCTALVAGQVVQPATAFALTIGEERDIGEKLLYSVRAHFQIIDEPDISQYVNDLGQKILSIAGPQYFKYHFFVVQSDEFNAFAAPSGLVFFYTGLIETMKSEDELLSVMAHEIAHVVSRHIAIRSDKSGKVGAVSMALALASLAIGDPALATGLFTGFQAAGQAVELHFSRYDEEEADRLAFGWMNAMRRNPKAMEGMLKTMRRISRYRRDRMPPYLLTHPNPEARLGYVQSLLESQRIQGKKIDYIKTDNFDFLRMKCRLLVAGNDPQKARAYFTNSLALGKNREESVMATYGLALLDAQDLNFSEALKKMEQVRLQYPDRDILKVDAAVMFMDSGDLDRAYGLLSQVTHRDPNDMYAAFYFARALEKKGEISAAQHLYALIVKNLPEYSKGYYELGRIEVQQGRPGTSAFYLGKYYLYEGKMKLAKEDLTKVEHDRSVPDVLRKEAKALLKRIEELENL